MTKAGATGPNPILGAWNRLAALPGGRWLFTRLVCRKAPYFASIRPRFVALAPGHAEVRIAKRRAVENHIGTVHAIAMCNMAELAAGVMTDVSIPPTHRWIPKGMTVEYLRRATTDLSAECRLDPLPGFGPPMDLPVTVDVRDGAGETVCRAVITMRVSPRRE
jgi:acyl-coenzyme A thioesterase PaaI-like protein